MPRLTLPRLVRGGKGWRGRLPTAGTYQVFFRTPSIHSLTSSSITLFGLMQSFMLCLGPLLAIASRLVWFARAPRAPSPSVPSEPAMNSRKVVWTDLDIALAVGCIASLTCVATGFCSSAASGALITKRRPISFFISTLRVCGTPTDTSTMRNAVMWSTLTFFMCPSQTWHCSVQR